MSIKANGCAVDLALYVTSTTCLSSSIRGASSFSRLMMRPRGGEEEASTVSTNTENIPHVFISAFSTTNGESSCFTRFCSVE